MQIAPGVQEDAAAQPAVPATMQAAVYRGVNDVRIETVAGARDRPGRSAHKGAQLRHLRHRPEEDPHRIALRAAHLRP